MTVYTVKDLERIVEQAPCDDCIESGRLGVSFECFSCDRKFVEALLVSHPEFQDHTGWACEWANLHPEENNHSCRIHLNG